MANEAIKSTELQYGNLTLLVEYSESNIRSASGTEVTTKPIAVTEIIYKANGQAKTLPKDTDFGKLLNPPKQELLPDTGE